LDFVGINWLLTHKWHGGIELGSLVSSGAFIDSIEEFVKESWSSAATNSELSGLQR
jgi:hypothetical protein